MHWPGYDEHPNARMMINVSQLLQGYNASDFATVTATVGAGFSGTYLSTQQNEGISKSDGQKEIWI